ncbi:hypothetical protein JRQ81_012853, partial [Phrynocephalus forsythii]
MNKIMKLQFVGEEDVERIYFVGSPKIQRRPIILKMFNCAKKEEFLKAVKSKLDLLSYKGTSVQVYQDFSSGTAQWRK